MAAERIMSSGSSCGSLPDVDGDEKMSGSGSTGRDVSDSKKSGSSNTTAAINNKKDAKKTKSAKLDRRDPQRFFGEGINFKAKLIGVRDVPQARGERIAHEALQELKVNKRTSGEHKQKININISLEGLKIRDEKTKEILFLHPVHKISFISQDAADNRAFGYIYGSPDNVHTFYAIKTEKAAHQLVMCMKNLFQIAYELKKKEIEQWRMQQVQQQQQFGSAAQMNHSPSTSLGSSNSNDYASISEGCPASRQNDAQFPMSTSSDSSSNSSSIGVSDSVSNGSHSDNRSSGSGSMWPTDTPNGTSSNGRENGSELLLDLTMDESMRHTNLISELAKPSNISVHQPTSHHDPFFSDPWGYLSSISDTNDANNISTNDPFLVGPDLALVSPVIQTNASPFFSITSVTSTSGGGSDFPDFQSAADPFNTNFVAMPFGYCTSTPATTFPISPIPIATSTATREHCEFNSIPAPEATSADPEDKYAALADIIAANTTNTSENISVQDTAHQALEKSTRESSSSDILNSSSPGFDYKEQSDDASLGSSFAAGNLTGPTTSDLWYQATPPQTVISPFLFSDLDPLGKDRPYVDKKDFFQDVKNPPKKVLKDLVPENSFDISGSDLDNGSSSFPRRRPRTTTSSTNDPFVESFSDVDDCEDDDDDDDDNDSVTSSALPPPSIPPPQLPLPLSLCKRSPSPASSLEDSSMQDSASNSSRDVTSSPDIRLAPPPLPPPRPQLSTSNTNNNNVFLPPPPPVPPKHNNPAVTNNFSSSESSRNSQAHETRATRPMTGTHLLSSPPIPIPGRRGRSPANTSSSSSSSSSMASISSGHQLRQHHNTGNASHTSLAKSLPSPVGVPDPNNNPMDRRRTTTSPGSAQIMDLWNGVASTATTTTNNNITATWSTSGSTDADLHRNELANLRITTGPSSTPSVANSNNRGTTNTTSGQNVFLNPPPPVTGARKQALNRRKSGGTSSSSSVKDDIFQSGDPFADDEFFAISNRDTAQIATTKPRVVTELVCSAPGNMNSMSTMWNNPFGANLNKT